MVFIVWKIGVLLFSLTLFDLFELLLNLLGINFDELLGNPSIISSINSKIMDEVLIPQAILNFLIKILWVSTSFWIRLDPLQLLFLYSSLPLGKEPFEIGLFIFLLSLNLWMLLHQLLII